MTNPYHDDKGRFTSREGMVNAVKELALKNDVKGYLALNAELQQIDQHNAQISKRKEELLSKSSSPVSEITNLINNKITTGELQHYYLPEVIVGPKRVQVLLNGITDEERHLNEEAIAKDVALIRSEVKSHLASSNKLQDKDGTDKPILVRVLTTGERQERLDKLNRKVRKEQFAAAPRFHSTNHRRVKVNSLQPGMVISDTEKVHKVYRDSKTPSGKYSVEIINVLNEIKVKHWNSSTEISVGELTSTK